MRILRLLSATPLLAALLVPAPAPAAVDAVRDPGARPAALPQLVDVRAVHRDGVDRVVFQFDDGIPAGVDVRYVDRLLGDGSGLPIRNAGRAVLQVGLHPTRTDRATDAPARRAFALPNVMTVVRSGVFEGWTTYGVGLARRAPVAVVRQPARDRIALRRSPRPGARPRPAPRALACRRLRGPRHRRGRRARATAGRVQQRRLDRDHRRRDHADAAAVRHGGLGQGPRSLRVHRRPDRAGGLDPGLPQPVTGTQQIP